MNTSAQHPFQMTGVSVVLLSLICLGCSQNSDPVPASPADTADQSGTSKETGTVAQSDPAADSDAAELAALPSDESAAGEMAAMTTGTDSPSTSNAVEESESTEPDVAAADANSAIEAEDNLSSQSVTLEPGTWDDVQACVADSAGKVVVVDLWSTSCLPCITELPHLGRLQREHPDDVVCISLSVDYLGIKSKPPEYYRDKVELVLNKCEADVLNYLCTTDVDTVFGELELASIPAVYVYGPDGELAQRFDSSMANADSKDEEPFTYEADIVPLVNKLISSRE